MWSPLIIQHAGLTVKCHCDYLKTKGDMISHWALTEIMKLLTRGLFTLVCLFEMKQQSRWSRNTYFPINQWSLTLTALILCVILTSLQIQSSCPIFACTARWLLPSFHGGFTDIKVYPLWCYTTLVHKLSQITASIHQKSSLSTKWKVSSLALVSERKLWWQRY